MPEDEPTRDDLEVILRLERLVRRSHAFTLAFLKVNGSARQRSLSKSLSDRLHDLTMLEVRLDRPIVSLLAAANEQLDSRPAPDALCVFGLERSLEVGDTSPLLGRLNHDRDLLRRSLPFPVLIWVPDFALDAIVRGAPDFWAWRSGVYEFADGESLQQSEMDAGFAPKEAAFLYSLDAAEKLTEIERLNALLTETMNGAQNTRQKEIAARLLHQLALLNAFSGRLDEARRHFVEELALARELGDEDRAGEALFQLANLKLGVGNLKDASSLFEDSARLFRKVGNYLQCARVLHQYAVLALEAGDYSEAIRLCNQALEIRQRLGSEREEAWSLHLLAVVHQQRREWKEALRLSLQSLRLFRRFKDRLGIAGTLNRLAMIEQDRGNLRQAEAYYREALETFSEIGDPSGVAFTRHQLGTLNQERGDFTTAAGLFKASLQTRTQLGDKRGMFLSLAQLGRLRQQQGDFREALGFYEAAQSAMPGWTSLNAQKLDKWIAEIRSHLGDAAPPS